MRKDLLDALPDAYALLNPEWRYVLVNRAAAELLGETPQGLLGRALWETWPRALGQTRPQLTRAREARSPFEAETGGLFGQQRLRYRFTFPDQGTLLQVVEIKTAGGDGATGPYDALLGMIGHELRNSFSSIKHGIELLRKEAPDRTLHPALEALERRAAHFSRIVDGLMDASAFLGHGHAVGAAEVSLADIVRPALEAVRKTLDDNGQRVEIALEPDLALRVDPTGVERVLINLLANAGKYSGAGSTIHLSAAREGNDIVIRVRDQGIGIAPEELSRLYEPFYRGARQSAPGLGVGLAVARRVVQLHGGSLDAASAGPGKGSEFTVRLPA